MKIFDSQVLEQIGLEKHLLSGQTAVVTGGGRGIGREIVRALAWLGAGVVIAELSETGAETEQLVLQSGGKAKFIRTDVSKEEDVLRLAELAARTFGPVDILINNAILCPVAPVLEMDLGLWNQVMSVNLGGAFLTCKAILPGMISRKKGTVINMISTDAMPGLSAYIATKQGLTGFSQSLAAEVEAHGINVIAFGPGMVNTPGIRDAAVRLAPLLRLTEAQFMNISIHPSYEGLMPPEHAAAATVYLAAKCAQDYHGDVVNGYEILERAGLLKPTAAELPEVKTSFGVVVEEEQEVLLVQASGLSKKLAALIVETEAEFEKLPIFVRPMARSGFKKKASMSIQRWKQASQGLTARLDGVQKGDFERFIQEIPNLRNGLENLITYYLDVPKETARFTKDADFLKEITNIAAEREKFLRTLIEVLDKIYGKS